MVALSSSDSNNCPSEVMGLSNALMVALSTCDTEKWSTLKTWAGSAANTRRDSPISSFDYESSVPIRQLRSETRALCQTQRRLSEADVTRMRQRYEDGATVYAIGAEFRVDRRTVAERLKKSGVSLRGRSPSEDAIVAMLALHDSGLSMFEIGKKLGFCYNTVRTHLSSASNALTEQRREG